MEGHEGDPALLGQFVETGLGRGVLARCLGFGKGLGVDDGKDVVDDVVGLARAGWAVEDGVEGMGCGRFLWRVGRSVVIPGILVGEFQHVADEQDEIHLFEVAVGELGFLAVIQGLDGLVVRGVVARVRQMESSDDDFNPAGAVDPDEFVRMVEFKDFEGEAMANDFRNGGLPVRSHESVQRFQNATVKHFCVRTKWLSAPNSLREFRGKDGVLILFIEQAVTSGGAGEVFAESNGAPLDPPAEIVLVAAANAVLLGGEGGKCVQRETGDKGLPSGFGLFASRQDFGRGSERRKEGIEAGFQISGGRSDRQGHAGVPFCDEADKAVPLFLGNFEEGPLEMEIGE